MLGLILAREENKELRKEARKVGKGQVINAQNDDPVDAIRDLTGGKGVGGVLECSGNAIARKQAATVASRSATVVYVGGGSASDLTVDFADVLTKDLTVRDLPVPAVPSNIKRNASSNKDLSNATISWGNFCHPSKSSRATASAPSPTPALPYHFSLNSFTRWYSPQCTFA